MDGLRSSVALAAAVPSSAWEGGRSTGRRSPRLVAGLVLTGLLVAMTLLSFAWTPEAAPTKLRLLQKLRPPSLSLEGLLGTDHFGRDVLSLVMLGGRASLGIAGAAVVLGAAAGILLGSLAAIRRGALDAALMRICDIVFAFPPIVLAMMLGAALGPGAGTAVAAIAVFTVPVFARVVRGAAIQVWARDYVLAARGSGKSAARIAAGHVIPNIAGEIVVQAAIQFGLAILTEAGLSFLGLGLGPPTPSWGRMLADAQTYMTAAPWLAVAPGAAVAITVLGLNLLGDGLRDRLDARGQRLA